MDFSKEELFDKKTVEINPSVLFDAKSDYEAEIVMQEKPVTWLANTIASSVDFASHGTFSLPLKLHEEAHANDLAELFVNCFKVALGARIAQCQGGPLHFDKRNFVFPSVLGPILAQYGVYHDEAQAYTITPVMGDSLKNDLKDLGAEQNGFFVEPEWYADAMSLLRKVHLMTAYGLPKDTTVDNPDTFKLCVEGNAVIGRPGMSVDDVLIAALVSSSKLTDLFGSYRTLYCGIASLRSAIENVGLKALHSLEMK